MLMPTIVAVLAPLLAQGPHPHYVPQINPIFKTTQSLTRIDPESILERARVGCAGAKSDFERASCQATVDKIAALALHIDSELVRLDIMGGFLSKRELAGIQEVVIQNFVHIAAERDELLQRFPYVKKFSEPAIQWAI